MATTALIALTVLCAPLPQDIERGAMTAEYAVRAENAQGEHETILLDVELTVRHPPRARVVFQLPLWTPGSYRLRDFPDRIRDVTACLPGGGDLEVARLNRNTWQVAHGDAPTVRLGYRVELGADDRFMMRGTERRCITYEGPAVYMYVRGHHDVPCRVRFDVPPDWSVATGLGQEAHGVYFARSYDFLADCPVKLGRFQTFSFVSHGKPIDVVVDGPGDVEFDHESWLANIRKITDCQGEIFGGFPFDRYVFLYTASPGRGGGGGLEHLTSTAIGVPANQLRRSPVTGMSVTAHEFFHLWNVKRIRPRALGPFDYTRPNRTTALWLMEGVTSYYTRVTLARCGLDDERGFWREMERQIGRLENNPAREHVSSAQASWSVWDQKPPDRSLDYYNSGQVLGLLLDVEIRARTGNTRSLDDWMRALFAQCSAGARGFDDGDLPRLLSSVCGGSDFTEFFDRYVDGTLVPPYRTILARAGVRVEEERSRRKLISGVRQAAPGDGVDYADPNARGARSARGQGRVLTLDGREVARIDDVDAVLDDLEPGARVRIVFRSPAGQEVARDVAVESAPVVEVSLRLDEDADDLARAIRSGIVEGRPGRPAEVGRRPAPSTDRHPRFE